MYERDHYEGNEGATLEVHVDENTTVELKQADFEDTSTEDIDGFSVIFEGSHEHAFDQGLHPVEHSEAGEGELFLVPVISKEPKKRKYQLVVSNLKDEDNGDYSPE
jgi:hypothetical protein